MDAPLNFDQCTAFIFPPATEKSYNATIFAIRTFCRAGHAF